MIASCLACPAPGARGWQELAATSEFIRDTLVADATFSSQFDITFGYTSVYFTPTAANTLGMDIQFSLTPAAGQQPAINLNTFYGASTSPEQSSLAIAGGLNVGDELEVTAYGVQVSYTVTAEDLRASDPLASIYQNLSAVIGSGQIQGITVSTDGTSVQITGRSDLSSLGLSVGVTRNPNPVPLAGGALAVIGEDELLDAAASQAAMGHLDLALDAIAGGRAYLGAVINRLTHAADNLSQVSQNTSASRSQIMDADYARASSEQARTQIMEQAATAVLGQANTSQQTVLKLLQG